MSTQVSQISPRRRSLLSQSLTTCSTGALSRDHTELPSPILLDSPQALLGVEQWVDEKGSSARDNLLGVGLWVAERASATEDNHVDLLSDISPHATDQAISALQKSYDSDSTKECII